jgi:hypothetical protein
LSSAKARRHPAMADTAVRPETKLPRCGLTTNPVSGRVTPLVADGTSSVKTPAPRSSSK